ncbi:MAG: class I SAM-dependent methyltransferase [Spirochaetota bacterium]
MYRDRRKYMKLNLFEYCMMNNPLRAFIQTKYEFPILQRMVQTKNLKKVLEIGCGNGHGTTLIKKLFNPEHIVAIDLDERMINKAVKRELSNVTFKVMDASKLDFEDNEFDAVFDFGIIHHIPNWKDCIFELKRVLKNNSEIILEDLSKDTFNTIFGKFLKVISDHPYADMYSTDEFIHCLKRSGFKLLHYKESYPLKTIKFFSLSAVANK